MKKYVLLLLLILLLTACAPSETAIQTALAETLAANPTFTPSVTITPSSTATATLTRQPTKIRTSTNTPTDTALPATQTVMAKNLNATWTSLAKTQIAIVNASTATALAAYKTIDMRDFLTYPDNHIGEKIVIRGRIFNINGKVVQIYVRSYDAVYVEMETAVSGIYENDYITVYGIVYGSACFNNRLGNQVCQPGIFHAWYQK